MLTKEMQQDYYQNVICNRDSHTRYWGLWLPVDNSLEACMNRDPYDGSQYEQFIGYGGLENISWENGNAEISLLIGPEYRGNGYGREAVKLFLGEAFNKMRLHSVYVECYMCGPWLFWQRLLDAAYGNGTFEGVDSICDSEAFLPCRKFWDGNHYDSYYFTFTRGAYENLMRDSSERNEQADTEQKHESVPRQTDDSVRDRCGTSDYIHGCGIE
jgi:hypothetical protein